MSSFTDEANLANEQRKKVEDEAKEAALKAEGPVESLDEIVDTIYNVIKERLLQKIKEGNISKKKNEKSNGLFKPKTITEIKYVYASARLSFEDKPYLAISHSCITNTDEFDEIISIQDRFSIKLIERAQYFTLRDMLRQKFRDDNIECSTSFTKLLEKKEEKRIKQKYSSYSWAEVSISCDYYLPD